jgi:hypothetical protein
MMEMGGTSLILAYGKGRCGVVGEETEEGELDERDLLSKKGGVVTMLSEISDPIVKGRT